MKVLWLVCEGEYDVPVLTDVLTNVLASGIIPKPCGGQKSAPSAAAYLRKNDPNIVAAYLEDRDYRQRADAEQSYTNGKPGFVWRRHAIESYLIEPAVIAQAFRSIQQEKAKYPSGTPAWVTALPTNETTIMDGLRESAMKRAPEEAVRMTIERIWEDLSTTAGRVQKRWPSFAGIPTPDENRCRAELVNETSRIIQMAQQSAQSPHLDPTAVENRYTAELARITQHDYIRDLKFLEEFHGKDLIPLFCEWLRSQFNAQLRRRTFELELVKTVGTVYQHNRLLYGTDDFLDLANGVRALASMPPLS